jgi:hypothetical protein
MAGEMKSNSAQVPPRPDGQTAFFCKLFSDHVSEHLCGLRRKELDHKGGFLCEECPMDAVMHKIQKADTATAAASGISAHDRAAAEP